MGKPGVMIYFSDAEALAALSDAERGRIYQAIIDYSRDGVMPDFSAPQDTVLRCLWPVLKHAVDVDSERYADICAKKSYAAYCRKMKSDGMIPEPYEEWRHMIADDNTCNHMNASATNININTKTNSSININTKSKSNSLYKKEEKEERKIEQQLKAEYEAAFGGGPSDLREWNYLIRTYGADAARRAMQEAKEKGMTEYAAWLFVTARIKFSDDG